MASASFNRAGSLADLLFAHKHRFLVSRNFSIALTLRGFWQTLRFPSDSNKTIKNSNRDRDRDKRCRRHRRHCPHGRHKPQASQALGARRCRHHGRRRCPPWTPGSATGATGATSATGAMVPQMPEARAMGSPTPFIILRKASAASLGGTPRAFISIIISARGVEQNVRFL